MSNFNRIFCLRKNCSERCFEASIFNIYFSPFPRLKENCSDCRFAARVLYYFVPLLAKNGEMGNFIQPANCQGM